jgi:hypothetical protein
MLGTHSQTSRHPADLSLGGERSERGNTPEHEVEDPAERHGDDAQNRPDRLREIADVDVRACEVAEAVRDEGYGDEQRQDREREPGRGTCLDRVYKRGTGARIFAPSLTQQSASRRLRYEGRAPLRHASPPWELRLAVAALQVERARVDAVPLTGGLGAVVEDVPQVRAARRAGHLDPVHEEAGVVVELHGVG